MVRRISSAQWWAQVEKTYMLLGEYIRQAKAVEGRELREAGAEHDCGHQFTIAISSCMHSSGVVGCGPKSHRDANWWSDCKPVTVRAHNLRDALLVAASMPLSAFINDEEDSNGWLDEAESLDRFADRIAKITPCACSAQRARAEKAEAAIEKAAGFAWDEGNAVGLDGWVGPARGAGEPDSHALHARKRDVQRAIKYALGGES